MTVTKPRKMDKNPLHDSALRIGDVHPGVSFIRFNTEIGIVGRGRFLSEPFIYTTPSGSLWLAVRTSGISVSPMSLPDMGIVRYPSRQAPYWNRSNFTIAASKTHLLPPALDDVTSRGDRYDWEDYYECMDELDPLYW